MNGALQQVEWESPLVEPSPDPALQCYVRRRWGVPNPMITYFASVPWMARAVVDLHPEYGLLMHLDQAVADLVVLVVSQENSCRFCYAAVRALLWAQGMSWARIQRIEQDLTRADLPPRTMAAVAFARSQSRSGPAAARAAREALLRAGLGIDEMKEIAFTAALTDFNNRAHTIPAIPAYPIESMPDRLYARLLRPVLGLIVKRHRYRGQAHCAGRRGAALCLWQARGNLRGFSDRRAIGANARRDVGLSQSHATLQTSDDRRHRARARVRALRARSE
jgi:AhpD family alkylhydroperoxidase